MADTVGDLIEITKRHLMGMHRAEVNRLDTTVDSDDTSVVLEFSVAGVSAGSILSLGDELMYVWAINQSTKAATVQRGFFGTEGAAHTSGDMVEVNPRFPRVMVRDELRNEISSWSSNVYTTDSTDVSIAAGERAANLTLPRYLHALRALRAPKLHHDSWYPVAFRVETGLDTADFAGGMAVFLDDAPEKDITVRFTYAKTFDLSAFADATQLDDIGIDSHLEDIPPIGAAWRLLLTREVKRTSTETQGEPRAAQEVPPGHILQTATGLKRVRDERIGDEGRRLKHLHRPRKH